MDEKTINQIQNDIQKINERLRALEKEQRLIIQDLLSGETQTRLHRRILENNKEKITDKKEKINKEIKIEI